MNARQYRRLEIWRGADSFDSECQVLLELLSVGFRAAARVALLGMALHSEAPREIQPSFQVIFQVFLKLATVHIFQA
jgi:hypothetical protein